MKPGTILIAYEDDFGWGRYRRSSPRRGIGRHSKAGQRLAPRGERDSVHVVLLDDEIEGVKACDLVPVLKKINGILQVIVISSEESLCSARRLRGAGIFFQAMKRWIWRN